MLQHVMLEKSWLRRILQPPRTRYRNGCVNSLLSWKGNDMVIEEGILLLGLNPGITPEKVGVRIRTVVMLQRRLWSLHTHTKIALFWCLINPEGSSIKLRTFSFTQIQPYKKRPIVSRLALFLLMLLSKIRSRPSSIHLALLLLKEFKTVVQTTIRKTMTMRDFIFFLKVLKGWPFIVNSSKSTAN